MYIIDNDGVDRWSAYGYRSKVGKELLLEKTELCTKEGKGK